MKIRFDYAIWILAQTIIKFRLRFSRQILQLKLSTTHTHTHTHTHTRTHVPMKTSKRWYSKRRNEQKVDTAQKMKFSMNDFSVNVTKSAVSCSTKNPLKIWFVPRSKWMHWEKLKYYIKISIQEIQGFSLSSIKMLDQLLPLKILKENYAFS